MASSRGFIVYPTYDTKNDKTIIQLYGRLENGNSFLVVKEFSPYFYIETLDVKKVKKDLKNCKIEETKLTNFKGEKVSKISFNTQPELTQTYEKIKKKIPTYEADIDRKSTRLNSSH